MLTILVQIILYLAIYFIILQNLLRNKEWPISTCYNMSRSYEINL